MRGARNLVHHPTHSVSHLVLALGPPRPAVQRAHLGTRKWRLQQALIMQSKAARPAPLADRLLNIDSLPLTAPCMPLALGTPVSYMARCTSHAARCPVPIVPQAISYIERLLPHALHCTASSHIGTVCKPRSKLVTHHPSRPATPPQARLLRDMGGLREAQVLPELGIVQQGSPTQPPCRNAYLTSARGPPHTLWTTHLDDQGAHSMVKVALLSHAVLLCLSHAHPAG